MADVAAAHGHEFSPQNTQLDHQSAVSPRSMTSLIASCRPKGFIPQAKEPRPLSAGSAAPMRDTKFMVLEGPAPPADDNDSTSRSSSITGSGVVATRGKRSAVASKTSFLLAHPPPAIKHRQRFNIRPKILLQLQQISYATRPVPILDVLPSVVFAPSLARKFPGIFKGKDGLGADDLVVVNSQNYESPNGSNGKSENISEDDSWDTREIVAAICQPKKRGVGSEGNTEICLNHGPSWDASSLPTGAYEFVSVDEKGRRTVARWVPRPPISRRRSYNGQDSSSAPLADQRRFTFSLINPDSRRHPVIATLSRSSIDVSDRYSIPAPISPESGTFSLPDQSLSVADVRHAHFDEKKLLKTTMIETDELLRTLIVITGIWVAFKEGYSPNFKYGKPVASQAAPNSPPSHKPRSLSINSSSLTNGRTSYAESPVQEKNPNTSPIAGNASPYPSTPASPSKPLSRITQTQRAYSTGTAFLQRANTRRPYPSAKNYQPGTTMSSEAIEAEKSSYLSRDPKSKFENEVLTPNSIIANNQRDYGLEDPIAPTILPTTGNTPLPVVATEPVAAVPTTPVVRNRGRVNKFFKYIRRASGVH